MKLIQCYLLLLFLSFSVVRAEAQQRIGLVLSGGGATGLAHVGVLKALEERGIPIDYITGTSAGALIGCMYAVGMSPEEIELFLLSDEFQLMTTGRLKPQQHFLYKEEEVDAGLFDLSFSRDSILKKSLPTNFTKSTYLDFEMLKLFGTAGASVGNDFDSLFVPFRCVASDITNKKSLVFSEGQLNQAVRASMTYPFYFDPIRINGILLFDGGLYNNFPADVMYEEFNPDFIIGSNVSYNAAPPTEDNLISQLTNMLVSYSAYKLPCAAGVLIQPETDINTFEFSKVKQAIEDGYKSAQAYLDTIEKYIGRKISKEELNARRQRFKSNIQPLRVSSITNNYYRKKDITYARKSMIFLRKREIISPSKTEKRYYRLSATPQIEFIYPLVYLKSDSTYNLDLEVRKAKDFKIDLGGHFSSRAVNTGYVGFTFRSIGKTASSIHASSYFGKFYGSAKVSYQLEIPSIYPISLTGYFIMNRWDYFRSFATFFEDVQPSFLVQNEMHYGLKFNHPIGNTTKSTFDFHLFNLEDDYYQTSNFTNKDVYDLTKFDGSSSSWEFMQHSLNRKQFASSGHLFRFKVRYIEGNEKTIPGSTSSNKETHRKYHKWINLNTEFQSFVVDNRYFHLGVHGKGVLTSQSLFANYTASLLALPTFSLIPDAETFFLPEYRSPQFVSAGLNMIFSFAKSIDLRFDTYYYQPFVILQKNDDGTHSYSKPFKGETYMASASLIYHSFIGPLRFTLNYFPKQLQPLSFQLSFGYVLFNDRAIR